MAVHADTQTGELSSCQFLLTAPTLPADVIERPSDRNFTRARLAWAKAPEPAGQVSLPVPGADGADLPPLATLTFGEEPVWQDLEGRFETPKDFTGGRVGVLPGNPGGRALRFRIAPR